MVLESKVFDVVEQRYGHLVHAEVLNELIQKLIQMK